MHVVCQDLQDLASAVEMSMLEITTGLLCQHIRLLICLVAQEEGYLRIHHYDSQAPQLHSNVEQFLPRVCLMQLQSSHAGTTKLSCHKLHGMALLATWPLLVGQQAMALPH